MGDFGVAGRHGHGHRFVATVDILRLLSAARRRFGEGFPYRRPFRPRRGQDEFDAASFDRFEHCLSAMHEYSPFFDVRLIHYTTKDMKSTKLSDSLRTVRRAHPTIFVYFASFVVKLF